VEAKLSSNQWKGLKAAKNGGANIAYVDKASLSAEEKAAIRALGKDERVKECSVYKLVYEKNGAPVNKPKTLPNTGTSSQSTAIIGLISAAVVLRLRKKAE